MVLGQLANAQANEALSVGGEDQYFEVEYSANMGQRHSYEASFERMLDGTFVRGEYRFRINQQDTAFIEWVQRTDKGAAKIVVGKSGVFSTNVLDTAYPIEYFAYYSYINRNFGARAELIEDFLGTGHGGSLEFSGLILQKHEVEWFVRADVVDSISRSGPEISIDIRVIGGEDQYFEVEYSANMGQRHSYEASFERMLDGTFVRGEYRFRINQQDTAFIEWVQRTDKGAAKIVVGKSGVFSTNVLDTAYPIEYFAYYSYINRNFGARAELIEDFLGTGHGGSLEFSGLILQKHEVEWFVRADVVDSISRLLTGVKVAF